MPKKGTFKYPPMNLGWTKNEREQTSKLGNHKIPPSEEKTPSEMASPGCQFCLQDAETVNTKVRKCRNPELERNPHAMFKNLSLCKYLASHRVFKFQYI